MSRCHRQRVTAVDHTRLTSPSRPDRSHQMSHISQQSQRLACRLQQRLYIHLLPVYTSVKYVTVFIDKQQLLTRALQVVHIETTSCSTGCESSTDSGRASRLLLPSSSQTPLRRTYHVAISMSSASLCRNARTSVGPTVYQSGLKKASFLEVLVLFKGFIRYKQPIQRGFATRLRYI